MKKNLRLIILLVSLVLLLSACSNNDENTSGNLEDENLDNSTEVSKEVDKEPLILNLEGGDWGYLTPYAHYYRGPGVYKMKLLFDSMLERGEDGLIPLLAETWEIDESGTDYTFKIREGVLWQDKEPMTTEDIKFSFEYYREHPPVRDDLNLSHNDYIKEINIIDDYNINIKVDKPNATLLERFGMARIIPKHIWENVDDPIKFDSPEAVVGCGPYKLVEYNKEQGAYKMEAFEDYWGPKPVAEELRFIPVSDTVLAFENGEIDTTSITPDILSKYENDSKYKVVENPAFWGYKLIFNMEKREELKIKDIRQAINYSIDKEELIEKVARGAAKLASPGYLPLEHQLYNENIKKYGFDLEKAKELLDGNNYEFSIIIGNSNAEVRIAELIKLNLGKIGIDIDITSLDSKSRDAAIKNGEYEIALTGHGGWGNDANVLREQYSSKLKNIPGYSNDEIDRLAEEQLSAIDSKERKDIIFELQELIAEEVPMIPLYNRSGHTVYRPEKYDGWKHVFNHHEFTHNKISYLEME